MLEIAEESNRQINEQRNNWTVFGVPNEGWARQKFGEPDVGRLWRVGEYTAPLDAEDPAAALSAPESSVSLSGNPGSRRWQ